MTTYSERLKDPRWQRRRLEILNRADFSCEECHAKTKTLHVHHKLYRKGAMPWEYDDSELEALCEDCHEEKHHLRSMIEAELSEMPAYDLERILGYAQALRTWGNHFENLHIRLRCGEHAMGVTDVIGCRPMATEELLAVASTGSNGEKSVSTEDLEALFKVFRAGGQA